MTSINADIITHPNPAKKAYLDNIKPKPLANINTPPSNNKIIEMKPVVDWRISSTSILKIQLLTAGCDYYGDLTITKEVNKTSLLTLILKLQHIQVKQ